MNKLLHCIFFFAILISCNPSKILKSNKHDVHSYLTLYSNYVKDSFYITITYPNTYKSDSSSHYTALYYLDANYYSDTIVQLIHQMNSSSSNQKIIAIGIGYKNIDAMDSLRCRDYTYPIAQASYEMPISGGAEMFYHFIHRELNPMIQQLYPTNNDNTTLMGHSLGGYFALYALKKTLEDSVSIFRNFIAASPSIHYNNYMLLSKFDQLNKEKSSSKSIKTYISFGELEDEEDSDDPSILKVRVASIKLSKSLESFEQIQIKNEINPQLGHLENAIPSYENGLKWIFEKEQ